MKKHFNNSYYLNESTTRRIFKCLNRKLIKLSFIINVSFQYAHTGVLYTGHYTTVLIITTNIIIQHISPVVCFLCFLVFYPSLQHVCNSLLAVCHTTKINSYYQVVMLYKNYIHHSKVKGKNKAFSTCNCSAPSA